MRAAVAMVVEAKAEGVPVVATEAAKAVVMEVVMVGVRAAVAMGRTAEAVEARVVVDRVAALVVEERAAAARAEAVLPAEWWLGWRRHRGWCSWGRRRRPTAAVARAVAVRAVVAVEPGVRWWRGWRRRGGAPVAALAAVAAKVAAVKVVAREVVKVAVVKVAVVKVAAREVEAEHLTRHKKQQRRDAAFFVVQHICGAVVVDHESSLGVATDQQRSPRHSTASGGRHAHGILD